jgi:colanic acid/amylovoran biosynthesis protein
MGPFETKFGQAIAKRLFASSEQILVRDEKSEQVVRDLSGRNNVVLAPDFGFAIQPNSIPSEQSERNRGRYLAIVPRKHFFDDGGRRTDTLLDELANFARGLLERNEVDSIVLVPQVTGPSVVEDDRFVVSELASKIADSRVEVLDTGKFGPSEFCGLYSQASAVVAVRLHGAILAMAGGTPALAIAYFTGKTSGVMEGMGFGDSWVEFDDCTSAYMGDWWTTITTGDRSGAIVEAVAKARLELSTTIGVKA